MQYYDFDDSSIYTQFSWSMLIDLLKMSAEFISMLLWVMGDSFFFQAFPDSLMVELRRLVVGPSGGQRLKPSNTAKTSPACSKLCSWSKRVIAEIYERKRNTHVYGFAPSASLSGGDSFLDNSTIDNGTIDNGTLDNDTLGDNFSYHNVHSHFVVENSADGDAESGNILTPSIYADKGLGLHATRQQVQAIFSYPDLSSLSNSAAALPTEHQKVIRSERHSVHSQLVPDASFQSTVPAIAESAVNEALDEVDMRVSEPASVCVYLSVISSHRTHHSLLSWQF